MGLPRRLDRRRAHRRRPRPAGRACRAARRGRAPPWRRCGGRRRSLGRRDRLRPQPRPLPAGAGAGHAELRRPAPGLLPARAVCRAAHRAGRACAGRSVRRFVGRGLRPYAVHANELRAAGRRLRRRRPPRPGRQPRRRAGLDRPFPEARRLAPRRALGLRGAAAAGLRVACHRPARAPEPRAMGPARAAPGRRPRARRGRAAGRERRRADRPGRRRRPGLPGAAQLRRAVRLQPGRELCAGDRPPG